MILFHSSGYRCLKHFYLNEVCGNMKDMFPNVVSYNRFTELQKVSLLPLFAFFRTQLRGKCTGISFVDSTPLRVCKNQRIRQHKVFAGFAERGCCSMGWFYGFKLHLICNERGELLSFAFTKGNINDRKPLEDKQFIKDIYMVSLWGIEGTYPSPYSEHYLLTEFICWLVWKLTWRSRSCPPETAC